MIERKLFHLHFTELDRLILEFIQPFFETHGESLHRHSWQRHPAGGTHLRLRLTGNAETLKRLGDLLVREAEGYMSDYPAANDTNYSKDNARRMLEREQTPFHEEELEYRNNQVVERPVPPIGQGFVSDEAGEFMEDFHHDVTPLANAILADTRPRREIVLRLYYTHASFVTGNLKTGSVSWKSHWEGFAATFSAPVLLERIEEAYAANKDLIFRNLSEVQDLDARVAWEEDPILAAWRNLLETYRTETRKRLQNGDAFTLQINTPEEAANMRKAMEKMRLRESSFVRQLWSDDRFLTSFGHDPSFQVPRILVNLFYNLIARIGMSPLDKMMFCHHAHKSVEEHFDCNLQDLLEKTMASVVRRSERLSPNRLE